MSLWNFSDCARFIFSAASSSFSSETPELPCTPEPCGSTLPFSSFLPADGWPVNSRAFASFTKNRTCTGTSLPYLRDFAPNASSINLV